MAKDFITFMPQPVPMEIDNCRSVVVARKLRKGESEDVNTSKAYLKNECLYPDDWYSKIWLKNACR